MELDPRIDSILEQWEHARAEGRRMSADELCGTSPELLSEVRKQIAALEDFDRRLATDGSAGGNTSDTLPLNADSSSEGFGPISVVADFAKPEFLAGGGIGEVFSATDLKLHRDVALKFLREQYVRNAESRRQFLIEAEVTGRLDHPGIVPVHGVGATASGRPFYAMKLIRGQTLEQAIVLYHESAAEQGASPWTLRDLLQRLVAICNALAYAHNRGIVHRDVKPLNIILGRFGETYLLDWGLALKVERDEEMKQSPERSMTLKSGGNSSSRNPVGTPGYMSPEQISGSELADRRADIFSLGVTLYVILTGKRPFQGENVREILDKTSAFTFTKPRELNSRIPKGLQAICLKAMAKDYWQRYNTALDLAKDIERWLADEPVSVSKESRSERYLRWARKHRAAALTAVGSLLVITFAISAAAIWLGQVAREQRDLAVRESRARQEAELARRHGLRTSATLAAATVAQEMDRRWLILESEARDPQLIQIMRRRANAAEVASTHPAAQSWLEERFQHYSSRANNETWFLMDAAGVHLARLPEPKTIGKSFRHRDYFHGLGQDLDPAKVNDIEPIRAVHHSAVIRSVSDGVLRIVFSAPILGKATDAVEPSVLGVIALTVDLGQFRVLEDGMPEDYRALLVDLREDHWAKKPQRGCILHHRDLASAKVGAALPRIPPDLLQTLMISSGTGSSQAQPSSVDLEAMDEFATSDEFPRARSANHAQLLEHFTDPILKMTPEPWSAAYAPVHVRGRGAEGTLDSGWVVIVYRVNVTSRS